MKRTGEACNAAKHLSSNKEVTVDFSLVDDAVKMLLRACGFNVDPDYPEVYPPAEDKTV